MVVLVGRVLVIRGVWVSLVVSGVWVSLVVSGFRLLVLVGRVLVVRVLVGVGPLLV